MQTDFLFVRPSFWRGVARLLDFGRGLNQFNESRSPDEADCRAVRADWQMVGQDLRATMVQVDRDPSTLQRAQ